MANYLKSKVIFNKKLNSKFHSLQFKALGQLFDFQPGQFVVLKVNDSVFRSYSIASTPDKLPFWEMLVDISPQGPGTKYIAQLKKGDVIETSNPGGVFTLHDDGAKNLVLGATGCGIASIKPMIESSLAQNPQKEIYLFWGLRFIKDLFCFKRTCSFFQDLLLLWQKNPHFHHQIILSKPERKWQGKAGHITKYLCSEVQKLNPCKTSVYLCGSKEMIEEIKRLILEKSNCDRIYFEKIF